MTTKQGSTIQAYDLAGGAGEADIRALTGNLTLVDTDGVVQNIDPGGANRNVTLPAEGEANHLYLVYNSADAAENLVFKNDAAATIVTVGQNQYAIVFPDGTNWWGALISSGVPTNGILHITGTSVPTGFAEYTAGRGFLICGLVSGGTAAGTVGTAFTNQQDKTHSHTYNTVIAHTHTITVYSTNTNGTLQPKGGDNAGSTGTPPTNSTGDASGTTATAATSDVLAYIQLLGIQKSA